jgi:hypothetical protein
MGSLVSFWTTASMKHSASGKSDCSASLRLGSSRGVAALPSNKTDAPALTRRTRRASFRCSRLRARQRQEHPK